MNPSFDHRHPAARRAAHAWPCRVVVVGMCVGLQATRIQRGLRTPGDAGE